MPSNHSSERERDFSANSTADTSGRSTPDTRDRSGSGTSGDGRSAGSGGGSSGTGGNDRSAGPGGGGNTGTGGNDRGGNGPGGGGNDRGGTSGGDRSFGDTRSFDGGSTVDRGSQQTGGFNAADRGTQSQGNGGFATALGDRTPTGFAPTGTTARPGDMNMPMSGARPGFAVAATPTGYAPSMRQAEIESMRAMSAYNNSIAPTHRATEEASMARLDAWDKLLGQIRAVEGGRVNPYDRLVDGRRTPTHADLQNMTIREVMEYQRGMIRAGHPTTAVGAYQIVAGTLRDAVQRTGLSLDTKFSKATQDFLGMDLVEERARQATVNGTISVPEFANRLAAEWASFQTSNGRGRYDGDGNNHASVPHDRVQELADRLTTTGAVGGVQTRTSRDAVAAPVGPRGGNTALPTDRPVMGPAGGANALPADRPLTEPSGGSTTLPSERPSFAERYLDRPAPVDPNYQASPSTLGVGTDVREIDRSAVGRAPEMIGDQRELDRSLDGRVSAMDRPDNRNYGGPVGMGGPGGTYVGEVAHRDMTTDPTTRDGWSPATAGHYGARTREMDRSLEGRPTAANRPDNFNYGGPRGMGGPGGFNVPDRLNAGQPAVTAPAPAETVSPTPGRDTSVAPSGRPESPVQENAPRERSIGQRVAAGAIDIGAGMIPGIGPAIGIGNGIAAAIGARTLGERIVDGAGENTYQPGQVPDREGGNGDDSPYWFRNAETDADAPSSEVATPDDPVMTFTRRYLDPSRPTPGQKWGRPNQYGGVDLVG